MILGIMGNLRKPMFRQILTPLVAELRKRNAKFVVDDAVANGLGLEPFEHAPAQVIPDSANLVLSFGGDGTLLRTAHTVGQRKIPVLGVNLGPGLGFLTELGVNEFEGALDLILGGKYSVEERMLLAAQSSDESVGDCFALNDIIVGHSNISRTVQLEVLFDGHPVTTYRCDGLIVATPTGSTAYTLSVGGPIVEPSLNVMIVSPISPHTLTMRPVVISAKRTVEIRPNENAMMAADGFSLKPIKGGTVIRVSRAPFTAHIASITGHDFYHVLREKLQWGAAKIEPST
jgi:NAD+ kinase